MQNPEGNAFCVESGATKDITTQCERLASGDGAKVNHGGVFLNPNALDSVSSLADRRGFKPVNKTVVGAVQWYDSNHQLQRLEIAAMKDIHPDAKMGYLPDGRMYWNIHIRPVVCGSRKDWTLLAVYDSDHPNNQKWGGSVKYYPVKPNFEEMMTMVHRSNVTPKYIPHLLRDKDDQVYICTAHPYEVCDFFTGEKIITAATYLRFAMRWITVFELGLIDPMTWALFQQHGKI